MVTKLVAENAIDSHKTILINFLNPSPHSPKASIKQVTTIIMIETDMRKGPVIESFKRFMVEVKGRSEPASAWAKLIQPVVLPPIINDLSQFRKRKLFILIGP